MSLDKQIDDVASAEVDPDGTAPEIEAADGEAPEEVDQVERAAQGLITIGLFVAFVTFVLFCLPMYIL